MSSNPTERSLSRGRESLISCGRGGAGNIRPASGSPAPRRSPDDYSPPRGRELPIRHDKATSTGIGGAGNFRSVSKEARVAAEEAIQLERRYRKELEAARSEQVYSTGRGGAGNMSRSRSRSREPTSPHGLPSTGRGGLTNEGRPSVDLNKLEEEERKHVEREESTPHSKDKAPAQDHQQIHHDLPAYIACGRGGAGNIYATAA